MKRCPFPRFLAATVAAMLVSLLAVSGYAQFQTGSIYGKGRGERRFSPPRSDRHVDWRRRSADVRHRCHRQFPLPQSLPRKVLPEG